MLSILLAHAAAALLAPLLVRWWGRTAFFPLALVPLLSLIWVFGNWNTDQKLHIEWVPGLSMDIDMRFDSLAAIMSLLVLGIGSLILLYCARYFEDDEPRLGLFAAEMVAFSGAMFGLITSDNMLVLYIFWGNHDGVVVPAGRPLCRTRVESARRDAGSARHHRRWSGDAGGHHRPRPGRWVVQPVRRRRERPGRLAARSGDRVDPHRRTE